MITTHTRSRVATSSPHILYLSCRLAVFVQTLSSTLLGLTACQQHLSIYPLKVPS